MNSIFRTKPLVRHHVFTCRHMSALWDQLSPHVVSQYETVIGLEVHSQISSSAKLFSSSGTQYQSSPNTQVSVFDGSLPGTLPVLNRRCLESAIKTALALNCHVWKRSLFDRKHYFYADMPAGYQITQQRHPLATDGYIDFIVSAGQQSAAYMKRSKLKQIQLEQDSGKSLQDITNNRSLVDLNRAGIGLMEFVFEPDLSSAAEAVSLIKELILILKTLRTCTCKMEEGVLRVDANISVRKADEPLGVRTEVKNLNSFRFLQSAIEYEMQRQICVIESGGHVVNETRMYDMKLKQTVAMRDKEVVQDYRFMPEPNLPPILLRDDNDVTIDLINISDFEREVSGKQLPNQLRDHLLTTYGLNLDQIFQLMNEKGMTDVFIQIANYSQTKQFDTIFTFINTELKTQLQELKQDFESCSVDLKTVAQIIDLLINEQISSRIANQLLSLYFQNEKRSPDRVIDENDWKIITNPDIIEKSCLSTIESIPKIARKYAKTGVRKRQSMLIENVMTLLNNRVNESDVWLQYDRLLRKDIKIANNS